jgi:hypothetical protein
MKIGQRIKRAFGKENSVNYIVFDETDEHITAIISTYEGKITHKQVNAVLNRYPLGHWIFIESRIAERERMSYEFADGLQSTKYNLYLISVYRVNKTEALQVLEEAEEKM